LDTDGRRREPRPERRLRAVAKDFGGCGHVPKGAGAYFPIAPGLFLPVDFQIAVISPGPPTVVPIENGTLIGDALSVILNFLRRKLRHSKQE
jgi:hypothetical protein